PAHRLHARPPRRARLRARTFPLGAGLRDRGGGSPPPLRLRASRARPRRGALLGGERALGPHARAARHAAGGAPGAVSVEEGPPARPLPLCVDARGEGSGHLSRLTGCGVLVVLWLILGNNLIG